MPVKRSLGSVTSKKRNPNQQKARDKDSACLLITDFPAKCSIDTSAILFNRN